MNDRESSREHRAHKALLVDDNQVSQQHIKLLLERIGFSVTTVSNGAACISMVKDAVLRNAPFSIIFLDLTLPDITGTGVAKVLRNEKIRTPIVAITAEPSLANKHASVHAGCDGFLAKSSVHDTIAPTVARVLIQ